MLSANLEAVAERLAAYEAEGVDLHPLAISALVVIFRDLAAQARAMEYTPVPPAARAERRGNVVPLAAAGRRR